MTKGQDLFSIATDGAPGRPNEDFVVVTPEAAVVVDGAGVPAGGCVHGVAWYARQLGTQTMASLVSHADPDLRTVLAEGIAAVADLHRDTCDLSSPSTPCAAVGILYVGDAEVRTLALSDVTVVVETGDSIEVTCDLAIEELGGTEPDTLRGLHIGSQEHQGALRQLVERQTATRNRLDGWWVAAADPEAAHHAAVGRYARSSVDRAVILSDGATRPVDQMGLYKWDDYLDLIHRLGPSDLIRLVRDIEIEDPHGQQHPRTKQHDDATLAVADLRATERAVAVSTSRPSVTTTG